MVTLLVPDVDDQDHNPTPVVVSRAAIRSLRITASERCDVKGSSRYAWPGEVTIEATYAGLDAPISVSGPGIGRNSVDDPAPILRLVDALRDDLARAR